MKKVIGVIGACLLSGSTFAGVPESLFESGPVLGVLVGASSLATPNNQQFAVATANEEFSYFPHYQKHFTYGAYLGYLYNVDKISGKVLLGPVVSYRWFGKAVYQGKNSAIGAPTQRLTYQSQAGSLLAKGIYIFNNGFDINANVGGAYVTQKETTRQYGSSSVVRHAVFPQAGAGVGYFFQNGVGVNADFDYIFGKTKNRFVNQPYAISALTLDVSYKF